MNYLLLALSYLLGATPTSYWVGKVFHGMDLREHGSGNLGATNTFRILGLKWAIPVMAVDIAKGFIPVWFFPRITGAALSWTLAFGVMAILGHMFSLWVGFKGGKGVATSTGVFLALAPWAVLGGFVIWAAVTFTTRYVSLGSMAAAVSLVPLVWLTPHSGGDAVVGFTAFMAALIVWAHRSNIRRLLRGEENRFGKKA
ncbi:MAG: glycerol-3-phosphate 1-O-acyltransferase PlsY [Gemmatimonadota bacterium]